jgi:predicted small lipoprotein YifL
VIRAHISWLFVCTGLLGAVLILSSCGQKGPLYAPYTAPEIRFYSMNEQKQQRELVLVPGAGQAGCHNLPLTRAVHRVAQVGFAFCEIYAKKDCQPGSEHSLYWPATTQDPDKTEPTTRITPGAKWLFATVDTAKVGSWSCQLSPE